jgi:hypothetical protein
MKKTTMLLGAMLMCLLSYSNLTAQAVPDSTAAKKGAFAFSGYLDTYYFANLNNPKSQKNVGIAGNARAFEQRAGQFQLGLFQAKGVYTSGKVDATVDLTFGNNADLGNYGNLIGPLGVGTTALIIKQLFVSYKATDKLTFTAGQFGTHIGYELIESTLNYNYSLSNLFNNGPFYHIGLKANYAFSDKFSLMAGVVNNVDNLYDNNKAKGIIAQMYVAPAAGWNVYVNWLGSNESSNPNDSTGYFSLFDLTTTFQVSEKLLIGVNAAYGTQKGDYQGLTPFYDDTKEWGGVALYTNYKVSDVFSFGARGEYFDNTSGARFLRNSLGEGTDVFSLTITPTITLGDGNLMLKPEFRLDNYKKMDDGEGVLQQFEDKDGNFTKSSQSTIGMAAIFKF